MANKQEKRKIDRQRLVIRIIASFLAFAMVLGVGATLVYYISK